ncbi:erythromycin esterase family protein [Thiocapsa rosea]|nr:erythromycin esterase family protein [Thiocapsa rosea]
MLAHRAIARTQARLAWRVLLCALLPLWALACVAEPVSDSVSEPVDGWGDAVALLREAALPLETPSDLDPIVARAKDRRLVLLGEASHGTSEFYSWRAALTRRLIQEGDFRFVAVEGDWVPIYRLNRYVKGLGGAGESAAAVMQTFSRWPTWMWANAEMLDFVEWLRDFNAGRPRAERVGLYGIDVYGEDDARRKVLALLAVMEPDLGRAVADRYACLDRFGDDLTDYARAVGQGGASCETAVEEAVAMIEARRGALESVDPALYFHLEQSAHTVRGAERHYRSMALAGPESWNFRVDHFSETLERLHAYFGSGSKGIVWAHNTHIGDARATVMAQQGQRNIGQLAREGFGADAVFALGFSTYRGAVMAGRAWGQPGEIMEVPPAAAGSFEALMHATGRASTLVLFDALADSELLAAPIPHRAIGVVFRPEHERTRNYVPTRMAERYDALIYLEATDAVGPIESVPSIQPDCTRRADPSCP